jgi:hypothetical protein
MNLRRYHTFFYVLFFVLLTIMYAFGLANAEEGEAVTAPPARLHPTFPLLDSAGENVLDSGQPVSPMQSCGACHDTPFIAEHSFHADLGLSELGQPGLRAWDLGPGYYGRWDPLTYRYLDERDLSLPEWLMTMGARHVGGGPAVYSEDGRPLTDLPPGDWDWNESGVAEMNCFLCHLPNANNDARIAALSAGQFGKAATATLLGTGWSRKMATIWPGIKPPLTRKAICCPNSSPCKGRPAITAASVTARPTRTSRPRSFSTTTP